jgi:NADH-quinone oxidoreductase subunit J
LAFAALAWYARDAAMSPSPQRLGVGGASPGSLVSIGTALFTEFALPFEIASLILLAAIVGAVVVARRKASS